MKLLSLVLTRRCNLRCRYCHIQRNVAGEASWAVIRRSLEALLDAVPEILEVTFTGGEPLLAFATLRRAVSCIERRLGTERVRFRVLTNGLLLDEETLRFLDAHRFLINLSLDGIAPAQSLRGGGTHARLERLLDDILHKRGDLVRHRLKIAVTLSPAMIRYLPASVDWFIRKGVSAFGVSPQNGPVRWRTDDIHQLELCFKEVSATSVRHYVTTGEVPFLLFRKSFSEDDRHSSGTCRVEQGNVVAMDVDGSASACLAATPTYQTNPVPAMQAAVDALRLGPAWAAEFPQRVSQMKAAAATFGIFSHPERQYSSYRKCSDCEFLGRCHICPLASASIPGWDDPYRVSDFLCAFNQVTLAARDRFPAQPTLDDYFRGLVPLSALNLGNPTTASAPKH